jgi:hypothetical protein
VAWPYGLSATLVRQTIKKWNRRTCKDNSNQLGVLRRIKLGPGLIWVPKRTLSLKHCHFIIHLMYARNYTFSIHMNLMIDSWESCNTPSKIVLSKKNWTIYIFLFIPLFFKSGIVSVPDLRQKEQSRISIYSEVVHKQEI